MRLQHVLGAVQGADADDRDLADLAVDLGLPADGVVLVEPFFGHQGAVQEHPVEVQQQPAPPSLDARDQRRELRMVFFLDQGDAGHGGPFGKRLGFRL